MSQVSTQIAPPPQPLVSLTEDEILFRDNVRQFADEALRPKVHEMDEKAVFDPGLWGPFEDAVVPSIEGTSLPAPRPGPNSVAGAVLRRAFGSAPCASSAFIAPRRSFETAACSAV